MKSSKNDLLLILAIVFAIAGGILLAYTFSQPAVYENESPSVSTTVQETTDGETASSTTNSEEFQNETNYPINLNSATFEELVSIPQVGEVRANAIIEYREQLGGYSSVEQIKDIYGFGDALYNDIAGYLTV